jgi:hypothetical protein
MWRELVPLTRLALSEPGSKTALAALGAALEPVRQQANLPVTDRV